MPRPSCRRGFAAVLLLFVGACSAAPPPAPLPKGSAFCGRGARVVAFSQLGLARTERPFDVALTARYVWVLASPARLLRVARADGAVEAVVAGVPEETWTAMDADPGDGSIWIAARDFGFVHVAPDLTATRIKLQHAVEGKSAFVRRLLAGPDALYVQPFCSDRGVWRIGRDGKPLGTAFPAPQTDPAATPETMDCSPVRLERDAGGRILAYDPTRRAGFALAPGGEWRPEPGDLFAGMPTPPQYVFAYGASGAKVAASGRLVDWKGRPVFFGHPPDAPTPWSMAFYALGGDAAGDARPASCSGRPVQGFATGAGGYAALLADFLVYGELADAPELP